MPGSAGSISDEVNWIFVNLILLAALCSRNELQGYFPVRQMACAYSWQTTHLPLPIVVEHPVPAHSCIVIALLFDIHLFAYNTYYLSYSYSCPDGIWWSGGRIPVILNLDIWIWVISVTPKPLYPLSTSPT